MFDSHWDDDLIDVVLLSMCILNCYYSSCIQPSSLCICSITMSLSQLNNSFPFVRNQYKVVAEWTGVGKCCRGDSKKQCITSIDGREKREAMASSCRH